MTERPGGERSRRAGIAAEVTDVWDRLAGPGGGVLGGSGRASVGIAAAAACYVMPDWARGTDPTGVPVWWIWPAGSWGTAERRQELVLGAALALAAVAASTPTQPSVPTLAVVRDAADTRPAAPGARRRPRDTVLAAVDQARADLVDHEGLDPALSQRTTGLESLMLAAACYLLPTEMRQMARAGVPTIWAWPTVSWINHPDRHTELTVAAAMTQAVIELYDRTRPVQGRPSTTLTVIDGGENQQ